MPFRSPDRRVADRRMRARYKVQVPFLLKSNGQEIRGTTRNISLLGISAHSDSPVSQVQPVQCLLTLPDYEQPLVANGTVIRCEPLPSPGQEGSHEIGVFFKEFQGTGEADLSKFLSNVLQEEQDAIQAGYRALKQRVAARKKRKKKEALEKRKRKLQRMKKRKAKLSKSKKKSSRKPTRSRSRKS